MSRLPAGHEPVGHMGNPQSELIRADFRVGVPDQICRLPDQSAKEMDTLPSAMVKCPFAVNDLEPSSGSQPSLEWYS